MKEKTSFFLLGFILGALCVCIMFAGAMFKNATEGNSVKTLKLAHGLDTTHPVHIGMEFMKKRVEELSNGKMTIDIYSGGALGSETKCIEQLKNGSLDMTKASCAQIGTFVEQMHALTLAYLYKDSSHYWRVLDSSLGNEFLGFMKDAGLNGLCYFDAGSRSFYTVKKQIKTPEDLLGMKIRVMNSRADMDMISAMGGAPTTISAGETYTALAQGVIDGAENNLPTYYTSAHYEVAKYFTLDEHTRIPDVLIIGEKAWATLSDGERAILKQAAMESSIFQRKLWKEKTDEAREALIKKGVVFFQPDKDAFQKKTMSIYEPLKGTEVGKLVEKIRAIK